MENGTPETQGSALRRAVVALLQSPPPGVSEALLQPLHDALACDDEALPAHLFVDAVAHAPVAISITDLKAHILYTNPAFSRVTGYAMDEVAGSNESILSDKNTPAEVYRDLWQSLLEQRIWHGRLVNRRKDGTRYLAAVSIAPVIDVAGNTTHYLGLHRDISEQHRLQQQERNQKALIESMINAAPSVIALLGSDGEVLLDNLAYKTLAADMGSEPAEWVLQRVSLPDCEPGRGGSEQELTLPLSAGVRHFICSASWIDGVDEKAESFFKTERSRRLLLVLNEVTQLKREQEAVRINGMRALLAEQEKGESLREAIAAALFQLGGPLNMLQAALEMMHRRGDSEHSALRGVLDQAIAAGGDAMTMLQRVMPEERGDEKVEFDLNPVLREMLGLYTERLLAGGITVDWQPGARPVLLCGNPNRIRAMLKQLLDNAIESLEQAAHHNRELYAACRSEGDGYVSVEVADNGAGIPNEQQLKVFEPFFTTRPGHVGMGLAVVQDIVNSHAGTVHLYTPTEGGCRVEVSLPRHSQREERREFKVVGS